MNFNAKKIPLISFCYLNNSEATDLKMDGVVCLFRIGKALRLRFYLLYKDTILMFRLEEPQKHVEETRGTDM